MFFGVIISCKALEGSTFFFSFYLSFLSNLHITDKVKASFVNHKYLASKLIVCFMVGNTHTLLLSIRRLDLMRLPSD